MEILQTDVLVIGGGLAGLSAACSARRAGVQVALVSDGAKASPHVIGYSCPVDENDDPEQFSIDMMTAGEGLNKQSLVNTFVNGAKALPAWLEQLGQEFDHEDGRYALIRSLGHKNYRLVHHATATGAETLTILEKYIAGAGVTVMEHTRCLTLITKDETGVNGAILFDTVNKEVKYIQCKSVVLATGGCHLTRRSTYPENQCGDGYALAYHAGATILDIEFVQHEPLRSAVMPVGLSTTMLAKGGKLLNNNGERFVLNTYESEAVPTKDRLSQLITAEVQQGRGTKNNGVYADMTCLSEKAFSQHQAIYDRFMKCGIDLKKELVEVSPAAHSIMGGVEIDETAATGVAGLYAAGEVTGGLHGASRLGGNAGTETIVFGRIAGESAAKYSELAELGDAEAAEHFENWIRSLMKKPCMIHDFGILQRYARDTMEKALGAVRNETEMRKAMENLETYASALSQTGLSSIEQLGDYYSAMNLILVCRLICLGAMNRKESRGAHARSDYPNPAEHIIHIRFQKNTGMKIAEE